MVFKNESPVSTKNQMTFFVNVVFLWNITNYWSNFIVLMLLIILMMPSKCQKLVTLSQIYPLPFDQAWLLRVFTGGELKPVSSSTTGFTPFTILRSCQVPRFSNNLNHERGGRVGVMLGTCIPISSHYHWHGITSLERSGDQPNSVTRYLLLITYNFNLPSVNQRRHKIERRNNKYQ